MWPANSFFGRNAIKLSEYKNRITNNATNEGGSMIHDGRTVDIRIC